MMVNAYIMYKTLLVNEGCTPLSHYEFRRQVVLAKLDPENHGPSGHLVTADQRRGVARKRQSTSARSGRESAAKKLKMSASIPATSTRSAVKETAHPSIPQCLLCNQV